MLGFSSYALIPLGWLAMGGAAVWVTNPQHTRTRAVLRAVVLPFYGLAIRLRIIK